MKTNKVTHKTGTLTCCNGTETTVTEIMGDFLELPEVMCPDCGAAVEARSGASSGWFTGSREYYSTYVVTCPKCRRAGFPQFYQLPEQAEQSLGNAVTSFLTTPSYRVKISLTSTTT